MNKFKKFLKRLQPKAKYILGILGIAAIVSQGAFAMTKLSATGPRFNFLQGDYEMFRGANVTAGDTVRKDPISGTSGDVFEGLIYYHNGIVDTTAENTTVKVTIPAKTVNKTAILGASISADNAATITDTVVDGKVVGLSGLTVNLNQDANLALVAGSVRWYPNQQSNPENIPTVLLNGQTGNEIVGANGLNIGGINGCWNYAGYVTFQFKATPITNVSLDVQKTVRNVTTGETNFVEQTNASASNIVEFKINAVDTGNKVADNLIVKDTLPADLTFVAGSMKIARNGATSAEIVSDANATLVFGNGWNTGDLAIGATKADTITFQASAPANIASEHIVTNTVRISSNEISASDEAKVKLLQNTSPCIVLNKDAKNLTTGQIAVANNVSGTVMKTLDAKPGDTIEYTLTTKNTGNAVSNGYVIKDGINDILEEANFVSASNGGTVVATGLAGDNAREIQYAAVNIAPNQPITRTFTVKVMDPLPNNPASGNDYDHKLYNLYGDKVLVTISIPTPRVVTPILHIGKTVRDFTINELNFSKSDTAYAGDTLEYMIAFSNTGNGPADSVLFSDVIPANTTYIQGTTVISVNGGAEHTMADGIVGNGVLLDSIAAGDSGYIKIKVVTQTNIAANTVLTNTANLTDNGVTISDTALTTIKVPVVIAKATLPKTGADSTSVAAIISVLLAGASTLIVRRFA